jgi:hypothetical protein
MTRQQAAHLRMLETLPKRSHHWTPLQGAWGIRRSPEETKAMRIALLEADASGKSREQMKAMFSISQHTIEKLIGMKKK